MNHLLIRADGSKNIGMGHLNRCYLLAIFLKKNYNLSALFVSKDDPASKLFLANKRESIDTIFIKSDVSIERETQFIKNIIYERKIKLLILDLLDVEISSKYLSMLININARICVISDDSYYHEFPVELVINGNPLQISKNYSKSKGRYLIGPKYFIMDEIYSIIPKKENKKSNVLVTIGGSDHNNLLFSILKPLILSNDVEKIIVIASKATGYSEELVNLSQNQDSAKDIKVHFDVESLSEFWQTCGLAITAGGNTLFERIASGVPGATICQLERQMEIANSFEKLQVNINLGFGPVLTQENMNNAINNFIENNLSHSIQRKYSSIIVPGNGLQLCAKEIFNLI